MIPTLRDFALQVETPQSYSGSSYFFFSSWALRYYFLDLLDAPMPAEMMQTDETFEAEGGHLISALQGKDSTITFQHIL